MRSRRRIGLLAMSTLAFAGACSLVNQFDDVVPLKQQQTTPEAGTPDGTAPVEEAGTQDGGSDTGPVVTPAAGVVVVAGEATVDGGTARVLTALAPDTGNELPNAREVVNVSAIFYDGLRDLWYVFEPTGGNPFTTPGDSVFLHVRKLDTTTGQWTDISSAHIPTMVASGLVTVLAERLVYVAYRGTDAAQGVDLVTVDTSNPASAVVIDTQPLAVQPFGAIGTRTSSASGVGGTVTLLQTESCSGNPISCILEMVAVSVSVTGTTTTTTIGQTTDGGVYFGTPAYGSFLGGNVNVVGLSSASNTVSIGTYFPATNGSAGTPTVINVYDQYLKPFAFAECQKQALLVATNQDLHLYAIPTGAGKLASAATSHSGQSVYFEPYTSTVLTPFSQSSNFELTAFKLSGTAEAPELTQRHADWKPPTDLRPELIATRVPLPISCPPQ